MTPETIRAGRRRVDQPLSPYSLKKVSFGPLARKHCNKTIKISHRFVNHLVTTSAWTLISFFFLQKLFSILLEDNITKTNTRETVDKVCNKSMSNMFYGM